MLNRHNRLRLSGLLMRRLERLRKKPAKHVHRYYIRGIAPGGTDPLSDRIEFHMIRRD